MSTRLHETLLGSSPEPITPGQTGPQATTRRFILGLAGALHGAGVSAPELEENVARLGSALGQAAVALASPTSLFLSFPNADRPELHLERVEPGEINLGRLVRLEDLACAVREGRVSVEQGLEQLQAQAREAPLWSRPVQSLAFALASMAAAIFFHCQLGDAVAAGALGAGVGCAGLLSQGRERLARLLEPTAALASTLGALCLAHLGWISAPESVALAAVIVLVPGYSLTVALSELAQRHLTSGTTRLFGALGSFLGLGLGLGLGHVMGQVWFPAAASQTASSPSLPQPAWALVLALLATPVAFGVLLQVEPRHLGWVTLGGLVAFCGARLGSLTIGPEFGAGAGALSLGCASNLIARWAKLPTSVVLVPGILLLVPGSIGFHSVAQFLQHDPVAGIETAFRVALTGTTLVGGLLAAHVLIQPPRPRDASNPAPRTPQAFPSQTSRTLYPTPNPTPSPIPAPQPERQS